MGRYNNITKNPILRLFLNTASDTTVLDKLRSLERTTMTEKTRAESQEERDSLDKNLTDIREAREKLEAEMKEKAKQDSNKKYR